MAGGISLLTIFVKIDTIYKHITYMTEGLTCTMYLTNRIGAR
jgi:hypothetical protein